MSRVTFDEAKALTARIIEAYTAAAYTKEPIDNVVFGKLGDIPLLEMLVQLCVISKEHVSGTIYDKSKFQMVMRIINGKLLMRGQDLIERPDAYAWKIEKVLKAKNRKPIGLHPVMATEAGDTLDVGAAVENYFQLASTITDPRERMILHNFFTQWGTNLLLIHTDAEDRKVIRVTKEMIEKMGITEVPNSYDIEWPGPGVNDVELTPIHEGDALVLEKCSFGWAFYVIQREEFELTHTAKNNQ
jgi:hypothetical protein